MAVIASVAALTCLASVLAACSSSGSGGSSTSGGTTQSAGGSESTASGQPIKLGQIVPIDSPVLSKPESKIVAAIAVKWVNAHGGVNGRPLEVHFLNTGVPHAVVFVDDLEAAAVVKDGAALRYHTAFAPKGTNANFVQVLGPSSISIRTYERGVEGETLACGTGVCAAAILHHLRSGKAAPISVKVRGGDTLQVGFERDGDAFREVTLKGPADFVFDGKISL